MLCGWEINRRSGVALAMRHGLSRGNRAWLCLQRQMSTLPTLQYWHDTLYFTFCSEMGSPGTVVLNLFWPVAPAEPLTLP